MTQRLRYGHSSILDLEIPPNALVADCTRAGDTVIVDPAVAVAEALLKPMGYPPLTQAVVPGDRVVIAIDPDVPCWLRITAGVVHTLMSANVNPSDIVVLTSNNQQAEATWQKELPAGTSELRFVTHDPRDKAGLCYVAASKQAEPIYLNRHLWEADVVVPISLLRAQRSLGYAGTHSGLFPTFSDEATWQRFHGPTSVLSIAEQKRRRGEADEVDWLLGLQLTVQIVAGPGDSVLHALAGLLEQVAGRGRQLVEAAWSRAVPCKARLVVAAIEGGKGEQSWKNFGRALFAASQVCVPDGTIVLCTDLRCAPGAGLRRLAGYEEDARLQQRLWKERSEDAVAAALLLEHRQRRHIYLLSGLDESTVEALGIGYVANPAEINHLGRQADSCILLADAHRASPHVDQDLVD